MNQHVSRRAVARGAAWSVPLVAVGFAAPAFAASALSPAPAASDPGKSCKCPGGNSPYVFNVFVQFDAPGTDNWTISIQSVLFDGVAPISFTPHTASLPGGEGTVQFVLSNPTNNSSSTHDIQITYTANDTTSGGPTEGPITKTLLGVSFPPCKSPVTCP